MIRRATERDAVRIHELLLQVYKVHSNGRPDIFHPGGCKYEESDVRDLIRRGETVIFVYTDEADRVVGYAFCEKYLTNGEHNRSGKSICYIDDLCVDEACRHRGIGEELFRYVVDWAKGEKLEGLELNVWALNVPAMAFYRKMGMLPQRMQMELPL